MKLLIVEQDATQAEVYTLALEEEFEIIHVTTAHEALSILEKDHIGIVISSWIVGDETAASFCDKEYEAHSAQKPIVIVVSPDDSDETMRAAFSAGVSHYFIRPYNVIAFTETVIHAKHQIETLEQMAKDNAKTRETTKVALSQAAIYGTGMEIVSSLNTCGVAKDMAKKVLNTLRFNGVHCAIQFRGEKEVETFDTDLEDCDETTLKVFKVLHDQGRIYRFGRRLMLNDGNVSLLVKNIAKDDPVLYDAILDMGAKLVPALDARFDNLLQQQTLIRLNNDVNDVIDRVQRCIREIGREKHALISEVSFQIKSSFHALEMTEDQENFFMNLVEKELEAKDNDQELIEIDVMLAKISKTLKEKSSPQVQANDKEDSEYLDVEFF